MALKKGHTQPRLQIAHMLADGSRRHAEFDRGQRKACSSGGGFKSAKGGEWWQFHDPQG